MSADQTSTPTDLRALAQHTRWSHQQWDEARRYHSDFEELLPRIVEIDGLPKLVAEALRRADRESGLPRTSPGAKRYAEALARAVVADARVDALVELLAEQAYFRQQAESEMYALQSRVDLGGHQIIFGSGEVPPHAVHGLLDLTDGRCWVFDGTGSDGKSYWIRADSDPRGQLRYAWPIPDAGPFVALMDNWHLSRINDAARAWDETTHTLHRMLDRLNGYRAEGDSSYAKPSLTEALARVLQATDKARIELSEKLRKATGHNPSGHWSQRRWEDWSSELASLIPDGDESKYSNPEGSQESIILDVLRAYVAERNSDRGEDR